MRINVVAIWYSGVFLGFLSSESEDIENKFLDHIHIFAKRNKQ